MISINDILNLFSNSESKTEPEDKTSEEKTQDIEISKEDVVELEERINSFEQELRTMEQEIDTGDNSIEILENDIDELRNTVERFESELDDLVGIYDALGTMVNPLLEDKDSTIPQLEIEEHPFTSGQGEWEPSVEESSGESGGDVEHAISHETDEKEEKINEQPNSPVTRKQSTEEMKKMLEDNPLKSVCKEDIAMLLLNSWINYLIIEGNEGTVRDVLNQYRDDGYLTQNFVEEVFKIFNIDDGTEKVELDEQVHEKSVAYMYLIREEV